MKLHLQYFRLRLLQECGCQRILHQGRRLVKPVLQKPQVFAASFVCDCRPGKVNAPLQGANAIHIRRVGFGQEGAVERVAGNLVVPDATEHTAEIDLQRLAIEGKRQRTHSPDTGSEHLQRIVDDRVEKDAAALW